MWAASKTETSKNCKQALITWLVIEERNINHTVFFQNMYKLWTGGNYNSYMTCFPINPFKTVKHYSQWIECVNDFWRYWKTVRNTQPRTQPVQTAALSKITCTRLITDTIRLASMWLHNSSEQSSGTEKHM